MKNHTAALTGCAAILNRAEMRVQTLAHFLHGMLNASNAPFLATYLFFSKKGSRQFGIEHACCFMTAVEAPHHKEIQIMVGWLILFASMAVPAGVMTVIGEPATVSVQGSGVVFALLFMIGILTLMVRGRAW